MSLHIWRNIYYYMGWEYKPTETTEKIKRDRHDLMVEIRNYGSDIKNILKESGEIHDDDNLFIPPKCSLDAILGGIITPSTPHPNNSIIPYTYEPYNYDIVIEELKNKKKSKTTKKKRKRKKNNSINF